MAPTRSICGSGLKVIAGPGSRIRAGYHQPCASMHNDSEYQRRCPDGDALPGSVLPCARLYRRADVAVPDISGDDPSAGSFDVWSKICPATSGKSLHCVTFGKAPIWETSSISCFTCFIAFYAYGWFYACYGQTPDKDGGLKCH